MSLEALANNLGDISKQALNKFEKGYSKPNSTRILQLAKALNVKPEYFFRSDAIQLAPLEFRKLSKMSQGRQASVREFAVVPHFRPGERTDSRNYVRASRTWAASSGVL